MGSWTAWPTVSWVANVIRLYAFSRKNKQVGHMTWPTFGLATYILYLVF